MRSSASFVEFQPADCEQPIHRRFEQLALRCASSVAVRLPTRDITYAELNAEANRAMRCLVAAAKERTRRDLSLQAKPIALLLNQSYESIVWTLAVLKAGYSYAPLDQRLPTPVLRNIIEQLAPAAIVTEGAHSQLAGDLAIGIIPTIDAKTDLTQYASDTLAQEVAPNAIAYVFYTSGSTGEPKGVADTHRSVLHNVLRYTNTLKFAPGDILSLVQNPSFSGTVATLFGALVNGAAIAPLDLQGEGLTQLSQWLKRSRATVFHSVPSIFRQLADPVDRFPDLRLVRLEGDRATALDIEHFRANFSDHCTLVNGLGATECGLVRQFFIGKETSLDAVEPVPIGYPVPGVEVRIIDERGAELPAESTGEIVVESEFLAASYWNDPALTAEKFIALDNGRRRYRTGDLARMNADGCLFHLGRLDHRLRIVGEFVDTAEIEKALLNITGVKQCAVGAFDDRSGERRLCAYLVTDGKRAITVTELREALSTRLSAKLMPAAFIYLDALPLTKDLKVDLQHLPPPGRCRPLLANDFVAPQTPIEQYLARIWMEVLEIDEVGVIDSFLDLGGDSLQATRIVGRLAPKLRQAINVTTLFTHRTIRELTALLRSVE